MLCETLANIATDNAAVLFPNDSKSVFRIILFKDDSNNYYAQLVRDSYNLLTAEYESNRNCHCRSPEEALLTLLDSTAMHLHQAIGRLPIARTADQETLRLTWMLSDLVAFGLPTKSVIVKIQFLRRMQSHSISNGIICIQLDCLSFRKKLPVILLKQFPKISITNTLHLFPNAQCRVVKAGRSSFSQRAGRSKQETKFQCKWGISKSRRFPTDHVVGFFMSRVLLKWARLRQ